MDTFIALVFTVVFLGSAVGMVSEGGVFGWLAAPVLGLMGLGCLWAFVEGVAPLVGY